VRGGGQWKSVHQNTGSGASYVVDEREREETGSEAVEAAIVRCPCLH